MSAILSRPANASPSLEAIISDIQGMVGSLDPDAAVASATVRDEIERMLSLLQVTRAEVQALGTDDLCQDRIPRAGQELHEIVKSTEAATNTIMSAAEVMLSCDAEDLTMYKSIVTIKAMEIFEACAFQDITGQRVAKVVHALERIEERLNVISGVVGLTGSGESAAFAAEDERKKRLLLSGPALAGEGIDQSSVDSLFGEATTAGQSDIDALFS